MRKSFSPLSVEQQDMIAIKLVGLLHKMPQLRRLVLAMPPEAAQSLRKRAETTRLCLKALKDSAFLPDFAFMINHCPALRAIITTNERTSETRNDQCFFSDEPLQYAKAADLVVQFSMNFSWDTRSLDCKHLISSYQSNNLIRSQCFRLLCHISHIWSCSAPSRIGFLLVTIMTV
jgi:hypothetical protein